MAAGTVAEPSVGDLPVPVAVRGVAVAAESGVVVEPGGMDLGVGPRLAERLGDPPGPAGVNGISAPAVPGGDSLEQQVPPFGVAAALEGVAAFVVPLVPAGRAAARARPARCGPMAARTRRTAGLPPCPSPCKRLWPRPGATRTAGIVGSVTPGSAVWHEPAATERDRRSMVRTHLIRLGALLEVVASNRLGA
jgi:hypothetical protein